MVLEGQCCSPQAFWPPRRLPLRPFKKKKKEAFFSVRATICKYIPVEHTRPFEGSTEGGPYYVSGLTASLTVPNRRCASFCQRLRVRKVRLRKMSLPILGDLSRLICLFLLPSKYSLDRICQLQTRSKAFHRGLEGPC